MERVKDNEEDKEEDNKVDKREADNKVEARRFDKTSVKNDRRRLRKQKRKKREVRNIGEREGGGGENGKSKECDK